MLDSLSSSVSKEKMFPVEIIVVNDGSTDQTEEVVSRYPFEGLTLLSQPNRGVSTARNSGLQFATGKYVWFCDADDEVNPAIIPDLLQLCEGGYDLICLDTLQREQADHTLRVVPPYVSGRQEIELFRQLFRGGGMLWQFLIRREIIEFHHLTFVTWAKWFEDVDFLFQCQSFSKVVYFYHDQWAYRYYINDSGAMRNSKYSDRLRCSVRLSVQAMQRTYPDTSSRLFVRQRSSVSIAWCLRSAADEEVAELYQLAKPVMPLAVAGSTKQKIQIALLNVSLRLFRLFVKFL